MTNQSVNKGQQEHFSWLLQSDNYRGNTSGFNEEKWLAAQTTLLTSVTPKQQFNLSLSDSYSLSLSVSLWSLLSLHSFTLTSPCSSALLHAGSHRAVGVQCNLTGCHHAAPSTQFTLTPADLHCWQQPELEAANDHHIQRYEYSPAQHEPSLEMTCTVVLQHNW